MYINKMTYITFKMYIPWFQ